MQEQPTLQTNAPSGANIQSTEQQPPVPAPIKDINQPAQNQEPQTGIVNGQVKYAGFLKRFLAIFIDGIILMSINFIVQLPLGLMGAVISSGDDAGTEMAAVATQGLASMIGVVVNLAYSVGFLTAKGATPGKMALGLVVVNTEHGKISLTKALLRETVGKFVSSFVLLLGYFWVIWDEKKQGWHDKIAGTLVVEKKSLPQQ